MEKGTNDHKQGPDGPPSYEETMRQDALKTENTGYTHKPKKTSRKGYPGGEHLSYQGSKKGK